MLPLTKFSIQSNEYYTTKNSSHFFKIKNNFQKIFKFLIKTKKNLKNENSKPLNFESLFKGYNSLTRDFENPEKKLKYFKQILETIPKAHESTIKTVIYLNNVGKAYFNCKKYEKALKYFKKAFKITKIHKNDLNNHKYNIEIALTINTGLTYGYLNKYEEYFNCHEKCLKFSLIRQKNNKNSKKGRELVIENFYKHCDILENKACQQPHD